MAAARSWVGLGMWLLPEGLALVPQSMPIHFHSLRVVRLLMELRIGRVRTEENPPICKNGGRPREPPGDGLLFF